MSLLRVLAVALVFMIPSQGFSLIEGQLLVGQRSADVEDDSYSGMENKLSVYLDPIPLIPVGFGLTMASVDLGEKDTVTAFTGSEMTFDVTAWLPMGIAGFKPYAKLAYIISGDYSITDSGVKTDWDASGSKMAAGIKYSPLPLIALMFEVEKSTIDLEYSTFTAKSDNLGIFLGVAAGI